MTHALSFEEAQEIIDQALREQGLGGFNWKSPEPVAIQAVTGCINIVRAMQTLGYRVTPPLRRIK